MATVDTSQVQRELKRIIAASNALKTQLRDVLEQMENDPSVFPPLEDVPSQMAQHPDICLRKVKLIAPKQEFRLVLVHWTFRDEPDREDHVDVILAFPRKDNYPIDWQWIDQFIGGTDS